MRRPVPTGVLADLNRLDVVPGSGARVLRGPLPDQSAVIGVLIRLHLCGIDVRGVCRLAPAHGSAVADRSTETVLHGAIPHQQALIAIIKTILGWGIGLRGMRRLHPPDVVPHA